jgi:hypothetical protein
MPKCLPFLRESAVESRWHIQGQARQFASDTVRAGAAFITTLEGGAESWAVAHNGNAIFGMGRSSGLTPVMATQNRPRGNMVGCARVQD